MTASPLPTRAQSCSCEPRRIPGGCHICRDDIVTGFDPDYMLQGAFTAHLEVRSDFFSGDPIAYGNTPQEAFQNLLDIIEGES